jgi:hypothetical protein
VALWTTTTQGFDDGHRVDRTLGVVELPDGAAATRELLQELELRHEEVGALAVIVGGALAAAAARFELAPHATVSEGGAVLLCHKVVPGLAMLSERDR